MLVLALAQSASNSGIVMAQHVPVLLEPLMEFLQKMPLKPGSRVLDATFGAGGYSRRLLATGYRVCALDRDPQTASLAADLAATTEQGHFSFARGRFSQLSAVSCRSFGLQEPGCYQACVFDIGVSSMQLAEAQRGFSFRLEGPLDMRMDPSSSGPTAADILNWSSERELTDIFLNVS